MHNLLAWWPLLVCNRTKLRYSLSQSTFNQELVCQWNYILKQLTVLMLYPTKPDDVDPSNGIYLYFHWKFAAMLNYRVAPDTTNPLLSPVLCFVFRRHVSTTQASNHHTNSHGSTQQRVQQNRRHCSPSDQAVVRSVAILRRTWCCGKQHCIASLRYCSACHTARCNRKGSRMAGSQR